MRYLSQEVGLSVGSTCHKIVKKSSTFSKFFELTRNNNLTFVQELQDDELQDGFFQHTTVDNLNFLRQFFDEKVKSLPSVPGCPPSPPKVTKFNSSGLSLVRLSKKHQVFLRLPFTP